MYLIRLKRNVGKIDMIVRIILGSILFALGALRVFPGGHLGAVIPVILGAALVVEGVARY
ncbi:YgaP-like transmembrane domain [Dethiobacter alkaliphilus]|uniref:Inner membrane protein YgaP-like transmembrane domain-containing protein n=1 Tax=Dethiobacter alkaliphilus AHT 1 TaxID=555088 RepID=C0GDP6_DETAL|nr:YgaP-like transmembrane domain [Dethiobacter alkaliphilus]EEG78529.1 hypothetical protein DealDRAFT_0459 [Dethiobacter alkaliphilus AHT 1]